MYANYVKTGKRTDKSVYDLKDRPYDLNNPN